MTPATAGELERRLVMVERELEARDARIRALERESTLTGTKLENLIGHVTELSNHVSELRRSFLTLAGTIAVAAIAFAFTVFAGLR